MLKKPRFNGKSALRRATGVLQVVERVNQALLGTDEVAARVRRYVAAHEAPTDDRAAFAKLCEVIFAQGLGFEVVEKHRTALSAAFHEFAPAAVAAIDEARVGALLAEPIIRNRPKIQACIENARRFCDAAAGGTFLARIAHLAANDDAACGWPHLVAALQKEFCRLREPTARLLLKRWGFFTALAHPGSRRLLTRLGLVDSALEGPGVQCFVGALAQAVGNDPYVIEAAFAIFAGEGPCRVEPRCAECALNERCPAAADVARAV
jgi:3-methyladenine DNA glycosylase Tag